MIGEKVDLKIDSQIINYEEFTKSMRPTYYSIREINEYKSYFEKYWKSLKNIDITFCKNCMFYSNDHSASIEKIKSYGDQNLFQYFFKGYSEIESFLEVNDFIKFKIGRYTYLNKADKIKYFKHLLVANRSGSLNKDFRIEAVNISKYSMNWAKFETNLDFNNENLMKNLIYLGFEAKIKLIHEKIIELITYAEKLSGTWTDLINVDLFIIKDNENILLKINNLKSYSVIDSRDNLDNNNQIFLTGLKNLGSFFKSII